jgi:hypothetical protein
MQNQNAIYMLFGAALVCLGILASALADRIRGLRVSRADRADRADREGRESAPRTARGSAPPSPRTIPVVEPVEFLRKSAASRRAPEAKAPFDEGGDDVIAALVASGYKKAQATEAAWACTPSERATVEHWTAAALRRCARGGMS